MTSVRQAAAQFVITCAALLASCSHSRALTNHARGTGDGTRIMMGSDVATVIERRQLRNGGQVRVPVPAGMSTSQLTVTIDGPGKVTATRAVADAAPGSFVAIDIQRIAVGDIAVEVSYSTAKLSWRAGYDVSFTDEPGPNQSAHVESALEIDDSAQLVLHDAEVELFATPIAPLANANGAPSPRVSRRLDVMPGRTRVALTSSPMPVNLHEVRVFDPLGASFDRSGRVPVPDENYGQPADSHKHRADEANAIVHIGFQLLSAQLAAAVPALPGRLSLYRRTTDGNFALVGTTRVFDNDAITDPTIVGGVADGITGQRQRTEFTLDADHNRIVEEFTITLINTMKTPEEVLVREHLYRGQNWTLAFHSDDAAVTKEGPQQIVLHAHVGATATTKVLYRVVYSW